jgi:hypothetical protein
MAITRQLTPAQKESVKKILQEQAADYMDQSSPDHASVFLKESFVLFRVTVAELAEAQDSRHPLAEVCHDTGIWHHQVHWKNEIGGFARTAFPPGQDEGKFLALMDGSLARELDDAVQMADREFNGDDYTARLVWIVELALYFLLLSHDAGETVLIVDPGAGADVLPALAVLAAGDFVKAIRDIPTVTGIEWK